MIDLKEIREKNNMTQEELGREIGISRQAISAIETGVIKPSVKSAKSIAECFGFDWTEFFAD